MGEGITQREFDIAIGGLHEKIDDIKELVLHEVLWGVKQNTKRITCLENWRWYIVGGGSALLVVFELFIRHI